jgi:phosphate-selective porin OprO and OprP
MRTATAAGVGLLGALITSPADAQSTSGPDAEIALLKQQLKLLEQKLDKLQKQTTAKTTSAAEANARAASVANTTADIPIKGPLAPSGAVVTMPNNRPTICTADNLNCIAITSRIHFDMGGYDYHPNSPLRGKLLAGSAPLISMINLRPPTASPVDSRPSSRRR